jgi:spore coat protein A, manganese oxidase
VGKHHDSGAAEMIINRRSFLKLSAWCAPAFFYTRHRPEEAFASQGQVTPANITPYIDPLPIPRRLPPVSVRTDEVEYVIRMTEFTKRLHSQLPATRLWGFEESYPGPMVEAREGQPVTVRWENHLPQRHLLPVDEHVHGASAIDPQVRTVPHLHGARTASDYDGLPEKWFPSGSSAVYRYPNEQRPTMLWYHDHALGITRLNNYAGLSGVYILRGEEEAKLDLPTGEYEIPLILQDRSLYEDGQLRYVPTEMDGTPHLDGSWGPEVFGDLPVVNGAIFPVLHVEPRIYRFRVLNAANSRFFRVFISQTQRDYPAFAFTVIGGDGGLLGSPVVVPSLLLGPAERADILVDFSNMGNEEFLLANNAPAPFPGEEAGMPAIAPRIPHLMKIRVSCPLQGVPVRNRSWSIPLERLDPASAVKTRDFVLTEELDKNQRSLGLHINGKGYHDPVAEFPKLGSTEIWRFINTTDDAHPMHIHLVQFQIVDRTAFDVQLFLEKGHLALSETPSSPKATESGWKDTAIARPGEVLRVIVRFEGYCGRYLYHCHMLEHEDNDMMRPFEVVP